MTEAKLRCVNWRLIKTRADQGAGLATSEAGRSRISNYSASLSVFSLLDPIPIHCPGVVIVRVQGRANELGNLVVVGSLRA